MSTIIVLIMLAIWVAALVGVRQIANKNARENVEAYLYLLPAASILLVFWFFPVIFSVIVSFTNWTGASTLGSVSWLGIANYKRAISDPDFRQILFNTLNYVVYSVPLTIIGALSVAMLLNSEIKARNFFRTAYFLPYITTWVAVSVVFKYIFEQSYGLANYGLTSFGFSELGWLNESRGIFEMLYGSIGHGMLGMPMPKTFHPLLAGPSLAMFTVILTSVWRDVGYFMVIFLAGLQNIDRSYYEASEIDGASRLQQFRHITWPLLSPTTFFILVISMITAFKVFVPMYIMTPTGGPGRTTETIVFYLFKTGFMGSKELGYASAIAYILFAIILILTIIQNRIVGKKVHYE
ncbi:MAG: sugar ABC transporter permease [Candidatus Sumerlaeaceae bacterium]|nr:sugar ABC transporter permease [Candidatus Sumerlaeaceae bacterium]